MFDRYICWRNNISRHTDAYSIILHLLGIVSQTDIYTVLCRRLIEFHNETKLFVPPSDAELGCRIRALQDRRPDSYSEMKIRFVTKPIFIFPYNLILLPAGSIFQVFRSWITDPSAWFDVPDGNFATGFVTKPQFDKYLNDFLNISIYNDKTLWRLLRW